MRNLLVLLLGSLCVYLPAQDFMLQGWYWDYPSAGCGGLNTKWAVNLQTKANALGNAGFTYVWLPPPAKGGSECSVGYDPKDLYDLGDYGPTRLGSRAQLTTLITALQSNGMEAVADVVYNHRDGGDYEDNPPARNYIMNYPAAAGTCNNGVTPYPVNGKARWRLPLGGSNENNSGEYFFKLSSASQSNGFYGANYTIRFETSAVGNQGTTQSENEPNGGSDCVTPDDYTVVTLGKTTFASIDDAASTGCGTDEFKLTLNATDFNSGGDNLYVYIEQNGGNGTGVDVRPYAAYSAARDSNVIAELQLQTRTDFTHMPTGRGKMNYLNFKPNGIDPTCMEGDWDYPYFFFDVEQRQSSTQDRYNEWTRWLIDTAGFSGGLRMDAVKHFDPSMVTNLLNYLSSQGIEPGMIVGEIFDSNVGALNDWVSDVNNGLSANVDVRVFDFNLRSALKEACDQHFFNFFYDTRNVYNAGMVAAGADSYNVVTFVNNHDYRETNEPVQDNPLLAYVYLLTNNKVGLPCVFYPDFFADQPPHYPATNLENELSELMQLHQDHIFGANNHYYLNEFNPGYASNYFSGNANQCLIYQISGGVSGEDVVVAINFDDEPLRVDQEINLGNVPYGAQMDDVIGNSNHPYAIVKNSPGDVVPNSIYIDLPARSYSVWVRNSSAPLPADLLDFAATASNDDVQLDWRTAQETALSHYRIERSEDGRHFETIGKQSAVGNSTTEQSYRYTDRGLSSRTTATTLYYRLTIVDEDGTEENSPIRNVLLEKTSTRLWPNPVDDLLHITGSDDVKQIMVYDATGRLLRQQSNRQEVNTRTWQSGVYQVVIVHANGQHETQRIVKI